MCACSAVHAVSRFLSASLCELSVFLEVLTSDCHVVTLQHLQTVLQSYSPSTYLMREEEGGGEETGVLHRVSVCLCMRVSVCLCMGPCVIVSVCT